MQLVVLLLDLRYNDINIWRRELCYVCFYKDYSYYFIIVKYSIFDDKREKSRALMMVAIPHYKTIVEIVFTLWIWDQTQAGVPLTSAIVKPEL